MICWSDIAYRSAERL
jgi:hypothetical protein